MTISAKLVNPTPFDVKIPFERGININIKSDGYTSLTVGQMDDFRSGKPGSEESRKTLEFEGVFLEDSDLSYEIQALETCRKSRDAKKERVRDFIERTKNSRIAQGSPVDDGTMDELLNSSGYANMMLQISILDKRIKRLDQETKAPDHVGRLREHLDPDKTCFVLQPPRQFASKVALAIFLDENPDIKTKHEQYAGQMTLTEVPVEQPVVETVPAGVTEPAVGPNDA